MRIGVRGGSGGTYRPRSGRARPVLGALGDARGERVGHALAVAAGPPVASRPGSVDRQTSVPDVDGPAAVGEPAIGRGQRGAGPGRQPRAGPPGMVAPPAERSTGTPPAPEVAVDQQADPAAAVQPLAQHRGARPRPAGERDHAHAQRLAVRQEPPVERLGPQPLGHGQERARPASRPATRPAASQLPLCGSATTTPRPVGRGPASMCSTTGAHGVGHDPLAGPSRGSRKASCQ
jgi:hypothetical protein